jgi:hypothetical protein
MVANYRSVVCKHQVLLDIEALSLLRPRIVLMAHNAAAARFAHAFAMRAAVVVT